MDKNKKLVNILEAVILVVFGILLAIFKFGMIDLFFGIFALVAAVAFMVLIIYELTKKKTLSFNNLFAFAAFLIFGIVLLAKQFSLYNNFIIIIFLTIAFGAALIMFGAYTAAKVSVLFGVTQIIVGALAVTVGILYFFVAEFRNEIFWIIAGVLFALYGVILLVATLADKKLMKQLTN